MSSTTYLLFWLCYLAAGGLLFWLAWRATDWQKAKWLSLIIRLLTFVVIFTPTKLYHQPDFWIPAIISQAFDRVLGYETAAFESSVSLAVSAIVCGLIYFIFIISLNLVKSRTKRTTTGSKQEDEQEKE